jgi:ADP-ribose pyrophosphatase YjhB (NUDIX family)
VSGLPWRLAVRAVVLDPAGRVPLMCFGHRVWALPGGGIEPGESDEDALRRELAEELGLEGVEVGPLVWTREHEFPMERWRGQRERVHLVRTGPFELAPRIDLAPEGVTDLRWWTLDEIEASAGLFAPRRLGTLLRELVEEGPPQEPWQVGV